jgi:hypothetical protein
MSQYAKLAAEYKDRDCLVGALNEQGYTDVEVHEQPQQLFDYTGRATTYLDAAGDKANIIVRRKFVGGAANDLGFVKGTDGKYSAIVSRFDTSKHDTKWFNKLKDSYNDKVTTKEAKRQGLKLHSRSVVNGKLVVKYLKLGV